MLLNFNCIFSRDAPNIRPAGYPARFSTNIKMSSKIRNKRRHHMY
jgi:hypothetical protein